MIKLNDKHVNNFVNNLEINQYQDMVNVVDGYLNNKTGVGNDFLGWLDIANRLDDIEFDKIKEVSNYIKDNTEILLVIGIGGSYLGSRAVTEFLNHSFYNQVGKGVEIYFVGHNMSSKYYQDLTDVLEGKDFMINVISKSGTTLEPAVAFRYFKNLLVEKYGEEANDRIIATTDSSSGVLKEQANINNWTTFVVPDDIGGRFSVFSPVGLLPIAVSGINIDLLMDGVKAATKDLMETDINKNDAYKYAVIRNILYKKGKTIEMLVGYEANLQYINEWWKQLFGESEGKNNIGIFPTSAIFSTDLHSLGQYIQEGRRDLFETVLNIKETNHIRVDKCDDNNDGLNYLTDKSLNDINHCAQEGTILAHVEGNVPNLVIDIDKVDEFHCGYLLYFFEKSCAMSGYLMGVNPFDQPGVEFYKKNMFALLKK